MKNKYGTFTENQIQSYKKLLHSKVHWLLIYKEQEYKQLDQYFSSLQFQILGLSQLVDSPHIITLMSLIEAARLENLSPTCNFSVYRKAILDAHTVIDQIPESDDT